MVHISCYLKINFQPQSKYIYHLYSKYSTNANVNIDKQVINIFCKVNEFVAADFLGFVVFYF